MMQCTIAEGSDICVKRIKFRHIATGHPNISVTVTRGAVPGWNSEKGRLKLAYVPSNACARAWRMASSRRRFAPKSDRPTRDAERMAISP